MNADPIPTESRPTRVVNMRAGSAFDISIMRPSKWGNPFKLTDHGSDRGKVIRAYAHWIIDQKKLIELIPHEIKGRILGCCCVPDVCHGTVLVILADQGEPALREVLRRMTL